MPVQAGSLRIVGLGPGAPRWTTPEASAALAAATDIVGYAPYVARLAARPGQRLHASDNRVELERARLALHLAQEGAHVAVVSGGDPGVFAMAAAVFEAIDHGEPAWRDLDVEVLPGVSAMLAAAARVGAPLGHDFCAISLSANLKPWAIIEKRLRLAAEADFVIALYNPASRARPHLIRDAFALLRQRKAGATPVVLAQAVGRDDERVEIATLADADVERIDMRMLVIVGSSETRMVLREGRAPWVYTPRSYGGAR